MSSNSTIEPGSRVRMHFSLATTSGAELASTFGEEPATLTIGAGELSSGLEEALLGLAAGDRKTVTLPPEAAFGEHDPGKVQAMARGDFAADMALEAGLIVAFETPAGDEVAGIVTALEGEQVTVDFNHPLAGAEVRFEVEILEVAPVDAAVAEPDR